MNKKAALLIPIFSVIILSGVVFAFQKNNYKETSKKALLEEFGSAGIRSTQISEDNDEDKIPPAPFVKGEYDDMKNQEQTIAQKIDFIARVGKELFGIEKENFFKPINKMVELKYFKAPKIINVPEDYFTIQTAIDNANFGDTIKIASGEYLGNIVMREGISLIGSNKLVVLESKNPTEEKELSSEASELSSFSSAKQIIINETIINGDNSGNVVEFKNGITDKTRLSNFTIKNSGKNLSGILIENSSPLINDNILKDNEYGIYIKENSSPVIQKNVINFNNKGIQVYKFAEETENDFKSDDTKKQDGSTALRDHGANEMLGSVFSSIIIDNLITDNKTGIDLYNSSALINHNTISYNNHYKTYLGPTFGIYIAKSSAEITNNIITDNGICDLCAGINADEKSKDILISYNNIWGNKNNFVCFGKCVLEDNNLSEDPKFVNCVASNFRLKEESGLIGMCEDESDMGMRW